VIYPKIRFNTCIKTNRDGGGIPRLSSVGIIYGIRRPKLSSCSGRQKLVGRPRLMMYYHGGLKKGHFPGSSTITYCNVLGGSLFTMDLLHSKSQYTTVKHSQQLFEHTYTSDPHGLGTLTPIEFFQQGLLWQSSNTRFHSYSQKASKHTSGQSIVGLSVRLHTTTAPRRIVHR
jgi:hypothetical protein